MDDKFTVYFEDPFWIGIVEIIDDGKIKIGKVVFGSEPSGADIYNFTKNEFHKIKYNETKVENKEITAKEINPKRMIKLAKRDQENKGLGTKSQLALKRIQENQKIEIKEKKHLIKHIKRKKKEKGH